MVATLNQSLKGGKEYLFHNCSFAKLVAHGRELLPVLQSRMHKITDVKAQWHANIRKNIIKLWLVPGESIEDDILLEQNFDFWHIIFRRNSNKNSL